MKSSFEGGLNQREACFIGPHRQSIQILSSIYIDPIVFPGICGNKQEYNYFTHAYYQEVERYLSRFRSALT